MAGAEKGGGSPPAIRLKSEDYEVEASEEALREILDFFGDMWAEALQWAQDAPLQFTLVILLAAFWVYIRSRERVDKSSLKAQYQERRRESRPSAPLIEEIEAAEEKESGEHDKNG